MATAIAMTTEKFLHLLYTFSERKTRMLYVCLALSPSNMAAARQPKRVAASQPGFMTLKSSTNPADLYSNKRKRVNKNKKKNWNKHSDINDVEEFLEDIRLQERTTGGLLTEKPDDSLFFLDIGQPKKNEVKAPEPEEGKNRKGKSSRPLRIDLILQHDSLIPPPKDVLAYQQPNAKKLRRSEHLAAKGAAPRRQKLLLNRRHVPRTTKRAATEANNNPNRDYYDIWGQETKDTADPWYLQQTKKKRVKRPEKLNAKPSELPAVEIIAPGGSYNPDFFAHQSLLQEAHEIEVVKQKVEQKIERQLAYNKSEAATEETTFQEQVQGLVEDEDNDEDFDEKTEVEEEDGAFGAIVVAQKKTERQRKRERAEKVKEQRRLTNKRNMEKRQQLFQLRTIKTNIKKQDAKTKEKQIKRKAKQEAQKAQPRRLGRLKFQPQDMEVQLSDELAGCLRRLKPEGSVLKDRFKSLQKRNLIEPRERAKFKRRLKVKYVEKRAFREIS